MSRASVRAEQTGVVVSPPTAAKKTAFIAAPESVETSAIRQALERQGLTGLTLAEVAVPGRTLAEVVIEVIDRADLVLLVVADGSQAGNALFALGYALGRKKRILVLLSPDVDVPILPVPGVAMLRAKPDRPGALDFGLAQLLAAPPRKKGAARTPRQTAPLGPRADELLRQLAEVGARGEIPLAEIVTRALRESGAVVGAIGGGRGDRFALWSDDLEPWLSNPVLVQVQMQQGGEPALPAIVDQVRDAMTDANVSWGLVVHHSREGSAEGKALPAGPVLVVSAQRFLQSLRSTRLGELMRQLRDESGGWRA
jgi:hypothetical protein